MKDLALCGPFLGLAMVPWQLQRRAEGEDVLPPPLSWVAVEAVGAVEGSSSFIHPVLDLAPVVASVDATALSSFDLDRTKANEDQS